MLGMYSRSWFQEKRLPLDFQATWVMPLGTCFHADILRSSSLSPGTYHSCPVDEWDKTVTSVFASDSDARHDLLQSAEVLAVLAIHLIVFTMLPCLNAVLTCFSVFLHCCHGSNPVSPNHPSAVKSVRAEIWTTFNYSEVQGTASWGYKHTNGPY